MTCLSSPRAKVSLSNKQAVLSRDGRSLKTSFRRPARRHVPGLSLVARPFVRLRDEGCSGGPSRASRTEGEPWENIAKLLSRSTLPRELKHAVAVAESGRTGKFRFLGEIENRPATIARTIKKLGRRYDRLHVCFEAGPTGYGLCRQVRDLGHDCMVVAPALIPKRSGERVKTNRRDAVTLARLHRAGELTGSVGAGPRP